FATTLRLLAQQRQYLLGQVHLGCEVFVHRRSIAPDVQGAGWGTAKRALRVKCAPFASHPGFDMGNLSVNQNKLQKRLRRLAGEAVTDFNMIEEGDKVMVCLSGGKDSYTMLDVLLYLQKVAPIKFELVAVNMDQKQPGFPEHVLPAY